MDDKVMVSLFIRATGGELRTQDGGLVACVHGEDFDLFFAGFDDEQRVYAMDRLLAAIGKLRAAASARIVDAVVADLEAHPLGAL